MNISLVIISLNAEQHLEKCLNSCAFIKDIVIVDSGSQDQTERIAKKFGATFIHQDWLGFGLQKQKAVSLAKHDWVLCLDVDEFLSLELQNSIQNLKEELTTTYIEKNKIYAYALPRCNKFMGKFLKHGEGYPDWCIRLFNRKFVNWSDDVVHESVQCPTQHLQKLTGDLMHESGEDLLHYLHKQNQYTSLQAEQFLKQNKKVSLGKLILSPMVRFIRFYIFKRGFLDGVPGLVHISIGCFNAFMKYAKFFELQRLKKIKRHSD